MPRPLKPDSEIKKRWDALYVTDDQRREVVAAAKAADQSVSQYLFASHQSANKRSARSTSPVVHALIQAEAELATIAQAISCHGRPIDAMALQASLLAIERSFRFAALPWAAGLGSEDSEGNQC